MNWTPEEIKKLREHNGLSQKKLADLTGVSLNYIHLLEKGKKTPSKTLCLLLDCIAERLRQEAASDEGGTHG